MKPLKQIDAEFDKEIKGLLSRYNGEILNKFQDEYLMDKGPGCEGILFPVLEKAIEDFINPPKDSPFIKLNTTSEFKAFYRSQIQSDRAELRSVCCSECRNMIMLEHERKE